MPNKKPSMEGVYIFSGTAHCISKLPSPLVSGGEDDKGMYQFSRNRKT